VVVAGEVVTVEAQGSVRQCVCSSAYRCTLDVQRRIPTARSPCRNGSTPQHCRSAQGKVQPCYHIVASTPPRNEREVAVVYWEGVAAVTAVVGAGARAVVRGTETVLLAAVEGLVAMVALVDWMGAGLVEAAAKATGLAVVVAEVVAVVLVAGSQVGSEVGSKVGSKVGSEVGSEVANTTVVIAAQVAASMARTVRVWVSRGMQHCASLLRWGLQSPLARASHYRRALRRASGPSTRRPEKSSK